MRKFSETIVQIKITSATVIDGLIVTAGNIVEMMEDEAKSLIRLGKAELHAVLEQDDGQHDDDGNGNDDDEAQAAAAKAAAEAAAEAEAKAKAEAEAQAAAEAEAAAKAAAEAKAKADKKAK